MFSRIRTSSEGRQRSNSVRKRMSSMPNERMRRDTSAPVVRKNLSHMPHDEAISLFNNKPVQDNDKVHTPHRITEPIHVKRVASCRGQDVERPRSPLVPSCADTPADGYDTRPRRNSVGSLSPPSPPSMMVLAHDDILERYTARHDRGTVAAAVAAAEKKNDANSRANDTSSNADSADGSFDSTVDTVSSTGGSFTSTIASSQSDSGGTIRGSRPIDYASIALNLGETIVGTRPLATATAPRAAVAVVASAQMIAAAAAGCATLDVRGLDAKNADALAYVLGEPALSPRLQRQKQPDPPSSSFF